MILISYWNRDVNGTTNIYKIAYNAINNKDQIIYPEAITHQVV
jgi:hypothetical protein